MMALGRSPEYHWNQTISKSVQRFEHFCRQSPKEHSCKIISGSMHWLRRSHLKVFLFLVLVAILFNGAEQFEQF